MKDFGLLGVAVLLGALGVYLGSAGHAGFDLLAFLAAGLVFCAQIIIASTRKGVLVTSILAAGCNAYLLSMKFAPGKAICDIEGSIFGCTAINDSAASELFGVPVTLFGLAFYIGLGLASMRSAATSPRFSQLNGLFALGSLAISVYLGWEAKKIGLICPMCVTIYACNGLLLWSAFKGMKEEGGTLFGDLDSVFGAGSLWVITSVFALITLVGTSSWQSRVAGDPATLVDNRDEGTTLGTDILMKLYKRPDGVIQTDGTEHVLGRADARFTIVEFADYNCGHCAQASPALKQLISENQDIKLVFKVFPLSGACNPAIENPEGVERCKAAMAAECAGDQSKYFDMSTILFRSLQYRSDEDLMFMANEIGLDTEAWVQCMQSQAAMDGVLADARAGAAARVMGTPAMFVKGLVGDEWIEITQGPGAILALVEAKRDGIDLPSPQ